MVGKPIMTQSQSLSTGTRQPQLGRASSTAPPRPGAEYYDYLAKTPAEGNAFAEAMTNSTARVTEELARIIDTGSASTVADIGGSSSMLVGAILRAHPSLKGIVFDRPNVVESAAVAIREAGLSRRARVVGGDFFDSVPTADIYLLKHILHDWDDDSCIRILKNCRLAMSTGGRIIVIDFMLGVLGEKGRATLADMSMLVLLSGRERDRAEFQHLFEASGLRILNVVLNKTPLAIIEAIAC
jgi:O-methyltransferase domain